jgi:dsDNA-binding SOS-regulon protein
MNLDQTCRKKMLQIAKINADTLHLQKNRISNDSNQDNSLWLEYIAENREIIDRLLSEIEKSTGVLPQVIVH